MSTKYQIVIKGYIDQDWADWLGKMEADYDKDGNTVLVGWIVDNSAFFGFLDRIRDLNLTIISITELGSES